MHLISNQQRREIIALLYALIEMTADDKRTKGANRKRRAGLLVKKLLHSQEVDKSLVKTLKKTGGVKRRP